MLWVLAGLSLVAVYIDGLTGARVDRAVQSRIAIQQRLDRLGTENTLIYLAVAGRMNHRAVVLESTQRFADDIAENERLPPGEGELIMDGQTYAGLGDMRFALQDESGLGAINIPLAPMFEAPLRYLGLGASTIRSLSARVADYIDMDATLSVNGAEAPTYRQRSLPPPADWVMVSPLELKRVLGAAEAIAPEQWHTLRDLISPRSTGYNFNTMRPEILAGLLRLPPDQVQAVLNERAKGAIRRSSQVAMLTGRHLDIEEDEYLERPSNNLRLTVWPRGGGARSVAGIQLTLQGDDVPWRTRYYYTDSAPVRTAAAVMETHATPADSPAIDDDNRATVIEPATPLLR